MSPEDIIRQNAAVDAWNRNTFGQIKNRYLSLINSPKRSGDGFESLAAVSNKVYGVTDHIAYKFNRYLVFVHKGVGRGRPIGSSKVHPKPWLNPVLDSEVPKLADIVARIQGDSIVNAIDIR